MISQWRQNDEMLLPTPGLTFISLVTEDIKFRMEQNLRETEWNSLFGVQLRWKKKRITLEPFDKS